MKLYKAEVYSPSEILEKGRKKLPDGTLRTYNGNKYKKVAGKWQYLGKEKSGKKSDSKSDSGKDQQSDTNVGVTMDNLIKNKDQLVKMMKEQGLNPKVETRKDGLMWIMDKKVSNAEITIDARKGDGSAKVTVRGSRVKGPDKYIYKTVDSMGELGKLISGNLDSKPEASYEKLVQQSGQFEEYLQNRGIKDVSVGKGLDDTIVMQSLRTDLLINVQYTGDKDKPYVFTMQGSSDVLKDRTKYRSPTEAEDIDDVMNALRDNVNSIYQRVKDSEIDRTFKAVGIDPSDVDIKRKGERDLKITSPTLDVTIKGGGAKQTITMKGEALRGTEKEWTGKISHEEEALELIKKHIEPQAKKSRSSHRLILGKYK